MHRINLSRILRRPGRHKRRKGMLLMAGTAPDRGSRVLPVSHRAAGHMPFPGPGTGQREHFKGLVVQIHAGAQCPFDIQRFTTGIFQQYASDHSVHKYAVAQDCFQTDLRILTGDLQSLRLVSILCKGGRQSGKLRLSVQDLMSRIDQLADPMPLGCPHGQTVLPVVSHA